jgi:GT2 family glycosyltransferase
MKTLIAVPCGDQLEANFVECLLNLRPVGEVEIKLLKGTLVYDARNQLIQYALDKGGYDYILWLDSDMTFEPDLLERLLEDIEGRQLVTGLCFGRRPPFNPCIYKSIRVEQEGLGYMPYTDNYFDYPRDQIFEVEGCGFACVLMTMDMAEAMSVYGVPFFPIAGLGEDLAYCYRAKKLDYKLWCDSRLKIGHIMRMSVDENFRDNVFQGSAEG